MTELLAYFNGKITISDKIKEKLNEIIIEKKLVKGEKILLDNSIKKEHIFVTNGCLRSFYKTEDGKEHTIQFAIKNWWISDYMTLYTNNTSVVSIESVTQSKVLIIEKKSIEKLHKMYPEFETLQGKNFEKRIAALQYRILSLLTLSAEKKYNQFMKDYAEFEKIIPNYQIASYLGITPQTLSRIRKKRIKN